jgi:hypothetical protein
MTTFESLSIPMEFQAYALQAAIGGLGVCAVVLTVARCLRRRAEPLRYAVLFAGVIGLLAVPMLVGLGRLCQDALPAFAAPPPDEVVKFPAEMLPALLEPSPAEPAASAEPSVNVGEVVGAGLVVLARRHTHRRVPVADCLCKAAPCPRRLAMVCRLLDGRA